MITVQDVQRHKASGSWRTLEKLAKAMSNDASAVAKTEMSPLLGGGTRLMLALEHRISDDIDLFVRDPQWIGYLTPRLNDRFDRLIDAYDEGATSLKIRLAEGEIDFIVGMSLLGLPDESSNDSLFSLEPVSEVLAKKLFYRGWALTPRDLFDWWCIETRLPGELCHATQIAALIAGRISTIQAALNLMSTSQSAALAWSRIRAPELPGLQETIHWALQRLIAMDAMTANRTSDRRTRTEGTSPP